MADRIRLNFIKAERIACFDKIRIDFNPRYNLICGTNGVGKTSLLLLASSCFNGAFQNQMVRRNTAASMPGEIVYQVQENDRIINAQGFVNNTDPAGGDQPYGQRSLANNVIFLNTNRDFQYHRLPHISPGEIRQEHMNNEFAQRGIQYNDIKNWFANRWLFEPRSDSWPPEYRKNLELSLKCFSLLDPTVSLSHVNVQTYDVMVNTRYGLVQYELLSSGFRASLSLLLGIIKEIEARSLGVAAEEFAGIIIIDELDLHLHPVWQKNIPLALQGTFPNAQIIVTSHSPHMIQSAKSDQVIALVNFNGGFPRVSDLPHSDYGFQGWTIEEILEDVMGMEDTDSEIKKELFRSFEEALDDEDIARLRSSLHAIEHMLHPRNNMRKLVRIQAAPVLGADK
ncbi:hypothetical protein GOFOIKOB_1857 [Methylobacterium tardum]|nr:AAA family ATPase [Methylobacterium tardum]URD39302.1 AAA family ATPase [Methylobacterium tardum]GJE48823.1 hypothetical protein GOFOIKOB_1857 [Methylobacterium tardum]